MNTEIKDVYSSPEYKRSRKAYVAECTFEYFVSLLVTDAYLSTLLHHMGISDAMVGIISSLISFAFLFQLFAIVAVKRIVNIKRASIIFHFASQLFFMSLFFVPFLPFGKEYKTAIVFACVLLAYFGNYLVTSVIYKWGMSFVDTRKRASFGAGKEMVSLISGMVFVLVMGFVIDKFAADGNVEGGFIFIGIAILVCSILDLISLLIMKNPKVEKSESADEPIFSVIKKLFSNKGFICLLVASVLWYVATGMTTGFMGIYKTSPTELGFKVGEVQIINNVGCLCRFAVSKPFGKFSDKTSYATGILLGTTIAATCFVLNIFTSPSARWLIYVYTVLYNCSLAAIHQNFFNITFDLVETKYFVQASSVKAALSGVCGFGASLVGAAILSGVQTNGNSFMGIDMRGQQLLSAISAVIMIVLVLFVLLVLRKQKKIEQ